MKRGGRVTTSIQRERGRDLARTPWHGHNAWRDGSAQEPTETEGSSSGPKAASQWGHGGRWEGEQIRSRGENWDRFSCRCWDKRRTNDLTVWPVLEVGGGGDWMCTGGVGWWWGRWAQRGCDRFSGKLDLNYKRKMQIGLKSEENETRNARLVWVTLSLSCTKSTRVWYFALGGKNLGVLTI